MRVEVREVKHDSGGTIKVVLECSDGAVDGIWKSPHPPETCRSYDVEFDIDDPINLAVNAMPAVEHRPFLSRDGDSVILNGLVETIDEDRIGAFRLSPSCLVLLDFADQRIADGQWLTLTMSSRRLEIYPIGL